MSRLVVRIDALALRGVDYAERHRVAEAIEREMGVQLRDERVRRNWVGDAGRRTVRPIVVNIGGTGEAMGAAIARGIVGRSTAHVVVSRKGPAR